MKENAEKQDLNKNGIFSIIWIMKGNGGKEPCRFCQIVQHMSTAVPRLCYQR